MSAFIVISVNDSLNWIVDGIKDCRPHNPEVITYLSTGKIKKEGEDKYIYEYTVFSKHASDGNADNTLAKTIESDIPRNLFANQIAQFLNVCENEGEQINIFLLDNPITDSDFDQSSWLVDEIRAVYDSHMATNFQLVRVLFSYQIDKPANVNTQASKMILKQLTKMNIEDSDDFLTRILYIDNQNRSGAAMCLNKEEHDLMIPRMLCDLMMLLSNKDDSYNVAAAISSQTRMFAVGYSECMYYHDDVFKYFELAGKRDLIQYLLEAKNDDESLDFDKHPIGTEDRVMRLDPKFVEVPFSQDISAYKSSVDKLIDDIVVSFKDDLIGIREEALSVAKEKDLEETKKHIIAFLNESGKLPEGISDEVLDRDYESIAADAGIDISPLIVTDAIEKARMEYPEYIDRHQIYEEYLLEDEEGDDFEGKRIDSNIQAYDQVLRFLQTGTFKKYLKKLCELPADSLNVSSEALSEETPKKVSFFKRLFGRKERVDASTVVTIEQKPKRDWHSLRGQITSILKMYEERREYYKLREKVSKTKDDLKELNDELRLFKLTNHCSSVDSLIDLDELRKYHAAGKDARIAKLVEMWNSRKDEDKSYDAFFEDLKEKTKWDVFGFYYINWDDPFDFVKSIDLHSVCESLKRRSQPYVNTYTLGPNAENLTSYIYFTDNQKWFEDISQKRISLKDDNRVSCTYSQHICSKICMFQFLQMSQDLIEGLVDCYES